MGKAISVESVVNMDPQVVVISGSNDHLQCRGLLISLVDGSCPNTEVIEEAIMTLLSAKVKSYLVFSCS